jgi:lactate permease
MISPQTVTTGASTSSLVGKEGQIVARTFKHSLFLAALLGLLVMAQQYLIPWIIPH